MLDAQGKSAAAVKLCREIARRAPGALWAHRQLGGLGEGRVVGGDLR